MAFPPGHFLIRNIESNLVLDVKDGSKANGASVILWSRNNKSNQIWSYDEGFIVNKNSGLVLEISGYENGGNITPGSKLVQAERRDQPSSINQLWAYNYQYIMPYDPKVVLAAQDDNIQAGSLIVVDKSVDFPNNIRQQWSFESE